MKRNEIAETVLKTLNVFRFLMSVDDSYERNGVLAEDFVDSFFEKEYSLGPVLARKVMPFVQLKTTLGILLITFCYAASFEDAEWLQVGFTVKKEYGVVFASIGGASVNPAPKEFISAIWTACSHVADRVPHLGLHPGVYFDSGVMRLRALHVEVKFTSTAGFILFIGDYMRALGKLAQLDLHSSCQYPDAA
jgi:hypothetical protein